MAIVLILSFVVFGAAIALVVDSLLRLRDAHRTPLKKWQRLLCHWLLLPAVMVLSPVVALIVLFVGLRIALSVVLIASVFPLFLLSLRRRQVSDEPLCASCGYNLTHRNPQSTRCPECGNDLSYPDAIQNGQWTLRLLPLAALAVMALLLVFFYESSLGRSMTAQSFHLHRIAPVWMLLIQADDTVGEGSQRAAIDELISRLNRADLPRDASNRIVRHALEAQKNDDPRLRKDWRETIEAARLAGKVSTEQLERYFRQLFPVRLSMPPTVQQGNALFVQSVADKPTGAKNYDIKLKTNAILIDGGQVFDVTNVVSARVYQSDPAQQVAGTFTNTLEPGKHKVTLVGTAQVVDRTTGAILISYAVELTEAVTVVTNPAVDSVRTETARVSAAATTSVSQ
jgi:hypothetical protein